MTEQELQEIRERADKATSGPWEKNKNGNVGNGIYTLFYNYCGSIHDAEFIAHAREDIPKLMDEVERLKQDLDKTAKHCSFLNDELNNTLETSKMWQKEAAQLNKQKLELHKENERVKSIISGIHNFCMAGYEDAENSTEERVYDAVIREISQLHRGDQK